MISSHHFDTGILVQNNLGAAISFDRDQDAPAIIDLGGEHPPRTFSYRELHKLSRAIARGLLRYGLAQGDRVAIASANRAEYLVVYLGAMQAGLVPVPINIKMPPVRVRGILQDADARIVFSDAQRLSQCPEDIETVVLDPSGTSRADSSRLSLEDFLDIGDFQPVRPTRDQAAMFLYTSGSTGTPKGVVLSHASHLWVLAMRRRPESSERMRVLVAAPLYHMNALSNSHAALAQHDTVVLMPSFEVASYMDAIERYCCNSLTSVPTMFSMILKRPDLIERTNLSTVEALRMGSAPVSLGLFNALRSLFPKAVIQNVYGTTEAGPIVFAPHPEGLKLPPSSLGYSHPQVSLRIDGEATGPANGVLEIKCPAVMTGYHNQPNATGKVFTEDGFYRTGDIFSRDADGFYYFVSRADDMFSCGAENIYPGDVEKMLEGHPAIQQASVVPVADEIKGAKPVAFVVLKEEAQASEKEIQEFALANAPAYQHPRRVWFLRELPLASTNKIDKNRLIEIANSTLQTKNSTFAEGKQ